MVALDRDFRFAPIIEHGCDKSNYRNEDANYDSRCPKWMIDEIDGKTNLFRISTFLCWGYLTTISINQVMQDYIPGPELL